MVRGSKAQKRSSDLAGHPGDQTGGALTLRQVAAKLNERGIASPNGGRFHANSERRIVTARAAWRGAMAKGIRHYHKKLRRKAINETTARHVAVEEHP
jgi:hypothetical protein